MRIAIGLIGLGVAGGTIPTGLEGITHAGPVVGGTAAALALLVGICLAAPALARRGPRRAEQVSTVVSYRPDASALRSPARGI